MLETRQITSRRINKFVRKQGDTERSIREVYQNPMLTPRDREVLLSIYYQRCLTTRQIAEMHYRYNSKGLENSQSELIARRRIRKLFDAQLVDRFFVDIGNEGTSQGHIILDKLGAKIVAGLLNQEVEELSWSYEMNETRLPYLKHMVDINNFYISLLRNARKHKHEVTGYRTENHTRHSFTFWGKKMVCNPDAYGQYWFSEDEGIHFFLELDNGTMSLPVFQRKHQRYTAYYASKSFESIYGTFPLILTVTTNLDRALRLRNAIYGIDNTDLQWLFTSNELASEDPLGPIWYGKQKEPVALI